MKTKLKFLLSSFVLLGTAAHADVFTVTTTEDNVMGSLRAGLIYANKHPGTTIQFQLTGGKDDRYAFEIMDALPEITANGTVIDGPVAAGEPRVVLDGARSLAQGRLKNLLRIVASNCTVRAVEFHGVYPALVLSGDGAHHNRIEGCRIGKGLVGTVKTHPSAYAVHPGQALVLENGAHDNLVGGTSSAARNVLAGVYLQGNGTNNNRLQGNYIGVDTDGSRALGVDIGVMLKTGASNNIIGGTQAGARNVIAGNHHQIEIRDSATTGNVVQGNFIGTDATGLAPSKHNFVDDTGIMITMGTRGNQIGGLTPAARNVVAGNEFPGIWICNEASGTRVQGNYIGVGVDGKTALGNSSGVVIESNTSDTVVGGEEQGAGNVASGNQHVGVQAFGNNIKVQGNYLGVAADGKTPVGNSTGVLIGYGENTVVGGASPNARNIIAGNKNNGVSITKGRNCRVQGNYIGTDVTGTHALGNGHAGVSVYEASKNNLIGGSAAGEGNIIGGNARYGILITDKESGENKVFGNSVGIGADGETSLPNGGGLQRDGSFKLANDYVIRGGGAGIAITEGASGNIIGGTQKSEGNIIANNEGCGVKIINASAGNTVRGNSIYANRDLGINLIAPGESDIAITANDELDGDDGPNHLQNFPDFTATSGDSATAPEGVSVRGTLHSKPKTSYELDIYSSDEAGTSGYGQGRTHLQTVKVTTDEYGIGVFETTVPLKNATFLTVTATDSQSGETSEFSKAMELQEKPSG